MNFDLFLKAYERTARRAEILLSASDRASEESLASLATSLQLMLVRRHEVILNAQDENERAARTAAMQPLDALVRSVAVEALEVLDVRVDAMLSPISTSEQQPMAQGGGASSLKPRS